MDNGVNMGLIALAVVQNHQQNTKQEHAPIQLPNIMGIIATTTDRLIHTQLIVVSYYNLHIFTMIQIVVI